MAEFGIVGDSYGIDLPEVEIQEDSLTAEKNAARFSKSREYKALKQYLENRIESYQKSLPSGKPITEATPQDWIVANLVIAEFQAVLDTYENAKRVVEGKQEK